MLILLYGLQAYPTSYLETCIGLKCRRQSNFSAILLLLLWNNTNQINALEIQNIRDIGSISFFSFSAWNFTGCFLALWNKVHAPAKKNKKKHFLLKNNLKSCPEYLLPFFLLPLCGEFKSQDKIHTSIEELLMSVLSRCQQV